VTSIRYAIESVPAGLSVDQVASALEAAIAMWTVHIAFDILPVRPAGPPPEMRVGFFSGFHGDPPDIPFNGSSGHLGHGFGPKAEFGELAGDIHLNADQPWSVDPGDGGIDLATMAAHELGHVLGFNHSQDPLSIMFPSYTGRRTSISAADRSRAIQRYGARTAAHSQREISSILVT
jgi:hypothetical protein